MKQPKAKRQNVLALLLIHGEMSDAWIAKVAGVTIKFVAQLRAARKIKKKPKRRHKLENLLAGMTRENVHPEIEWGPDVGKEIWECED